MTDHPDTPDDNLNDTPDNSPAPAPQSPPAPGGERIAKVMARAGVSSRRDAERMILEGRVKVNGAVVKTPALDILPSDRVVVDGQPLDAPQETRVWLYYKPVGLVTSEADEKGRQTVFDALPRDLPRVMTVGRLDLNSEGLLLLTNDGALKRRLELPSTGWMRKYRVRVNGQPNQLTFEPLRRGAEIDGEQFQPMEIELDSQQGANAWLTVGIREGKNREIRRAMAHVGLIVNRLIRTGYGPFRLQGLEKNEVREVKRRILRDQLGSLLTGEEAPQEQQAERPRRPFGDRPRAPGDKPRSFGDKLRPAGGFGRRPDGGARGPRPEGFAPGKPRPARGEGGEFRTPRPEGQGDRPRKPWAARGEERGESRSPRSAQDQDGARKPRWKDGDADRKPRPPRMEGERAPWQSDRPRREDGERKPWQSDRPRPEGDRKPRSEGDRKPWQSDRPRQDGERKPWQSDRPRREDGDRKPWQSDRPRPEGDRKPRPPRAEGERKPWQSDRPRREEGDRKPWQSDRPRPEGDRKPRADGDRKPWQSDRPRPEGGNSRSAGRRDDGDRPQRPAREGDRFGGPKSTGPRRFEGGGKPGGGKPGGPRQPSGGFAPRGQGPSGKPPRKPGGTGPRSRG